MEHRACIRVGVPPSALTTVVVGRRASVAVQMRGAVVASSGPGRPLPPAPAPGQRPVRADLFEDFYDVESRASRSFESSASAHATIRVLLYERDQRGKSRRVPRRSSSAFGGLYWVSSRPCGPPRARPQVLRGTALFNIHIYILYTADLPLLSYIFERALEAHPKSQELLVSCACCRANRLGRPRCRS